MEQAEFSERLLPMRDKIFRFARSLVCDEQEAYDITQDIYERLWVRRTTLCGYSNLDAYVMSSVRNLCIDRLRSRKLHNGKLDGINATAPTAHIPDADSIDTMDIVGKAMAALPENHKTAMHLRDIEGMEIEDISEIMNADCATVRVWLSRARKAVREDITKTMNYGV